MASLCSNCGHEISEEARFCPVCGTEINAKLKTDASSSVNVAPKKNINTGYTANISPVGAQSNSQSSQSSAGYTTVPITVPMKPSVKKKKKWPIVLGVIVAIFIGLGIIGVVNDSTKANDKDLIKCAETVVSKQLKSPGSAVYSNENVVERDNYGRALVTLTVDSQNGFGAYLRENFIVIIANYNKSTGKFIVHSENGIQSYQDGDEFLKDTLIESAKTASNWGNPLNDDEKA